MLNSTSDSLFTDWPSGVGGSAREDALYPIGAPSSARVIGGESPLSARSREGLATRQSQGGNKLMKEADSKVSA